MTKTLRVWKSNRVDQEVRLPDGEIVASFTACGPGAGCWAPNRPLDMQVGQHIAFCMDAAFESADYRAFSRRNWDALLDAMETRWEKEPAQ